MKSIIFPGQGSQSVGMGKDLYDNFDLVKKIFKEADQKLNFPISKIWNFKHKMDNDEAPLRNVIILKKLPFLALSGDLLGDLKIWNLDSGKNYLFTFTVYYMTNFLHKLMKLTKLVIICF